MQYPWLRVCINVFFRIGLRMGKSKDLSPLGREQRRLQQPLGIKRILSWLASLPILLTFFALPLLAYYQPALFGNRSVPEAPPHTSGTTNPTQHMPLNAHPSLSDQGSGQRHPQTPGFWDSSWSPGPVAAVHQNWDQDCQACHKGGFSRVKDESCTSCHGNMGLHVKASDKKDTLYEEPRCASCHRDHKGLESLAEQNKHFVGTECAACHSNIKAAAPKTLTENVQDFAGNKHPAFRLQLAGLDGVSPTATLRRVRMAAGAEGKAGLLKSINEPTSLKFPHDVHLSKQGIESKTEKKVMVCADCHQKADTPSGFEPISMEKHCQSCHSLAFEPALPKREAPHGNPQQVLDTLAEFYAFLKANPDLQNKLAPSRSQVLALPGKAEQAKPVNYPAMSSDALAQANFSAKHLFEKNACAVCHEVAQTNRPAAIGSPGAKLTQYRIAPITPAHNWFPMARFDHKAHAFESCTNCHAAPQSKTAKDILMPGLENCQTCHAGAKAAANRVKSDCGLCHGYHQHNEKPATAAPTSTSAQLSRVLP